ncbi:MAG TPA: polysaccharide biosynthesis/export family protein [Candidatus Deferrimicrobiaceae bacterium]|nr:polysaccharide biosynthesis/export family protein [Candidatus Deferrimicrobiaceae bacterium]
MSGARCVVTSVIAIALTACGGARSVDGPDQGLLLRESGGAPSGGSVPAGRSAERDRPSGEAGSSTAADLNRRLLEQAARSGEGIDLPVGTGDLLEVSVFEVEELSRIRLRVPGRGVISLPLIGQIQAAGRTTAELEDEIRVRLQRKFMHDPQVSVFLEEHNSQRISVIGAVRKGGVFNLNRPLRLADALALAEGLTEEADRHVYVTRRAPIGAVTTVAGGGPAPTSGAPRGGGETTAEVMAPIDLSELADGREDLNVALRSGDVVHVPRAGSVYVGGSVERPGSFLLRGKTTVQQAILAAGGVKDVADWGDVRLYRKATSGKVEVTTYDLDAFEQGKPAPELQRNDVVVVGKSAGKAFFYGFIDFFKGALGVAKGI